MIDYPNRDGLFEEREELISKVISLDSVDRIPVVYIGMAFSPKYTGSSMADFVIDPLLQVQALWETIERLSQFGPIDGINAIPVGQPTDYGLGTLWMSEVKLPGKDLPDDQLWQVNEKEIMTVDDYETILSEGWPAVRKNIIEDRLGYSSQGVEELRASTMETILHDVEGFRKAGYLSLCGGSMVHPFDTLCGGRTMQKFFIDLFRYPELVESVVNAMLPRAIEDGFGVVELARPFGIWVPGWRTASGMISTEMWDRFVLPYYITMVEATIERGLVPVLHFDQDWTRDLEKLKAFPAKKCLLNLDGMTDIRKAKKVLGDHMAIMGDVPAQLFAAGTPADIDQYVRELVLDVGPAGLILCPGCDAPINTKPENMEAFIAAAHRYGS
jgi:hypothetical protein